MQYGSIIIDYAILLIHKEREIRGEGSIKPYLSTYLLPIGKSEFNKV